MLLQALEKIEQLQYDMHSLLVIRNGYQVMEVYYYPYNKDILHSLYSCTKSFVSTLIGIAIDKGYIKGVDQKVLDFFPGLTPKNLDTQKENLTLENLLSMTAGFDWPENEYNFNDARNPFYGMEHSNNWVNYILDKKIIRRPGTVFNYNSGASFLLAAIVAKSTQTDVSSFARQNLFGLLGIQEFLWAKDPEGINTGGWGLFLKPRDMAKLGYLFLHNGRWADRQIVSADWVKAAVQKHAEWKNQSFYDSGNGGYGYQWWLVNNGGYTALGFGSQIILVYPDKNLVIVTTCDILNPTDQQGLFRIINNKIYAAVKSDGSLPPAADSDRALETKIREVSQAEKHKVMVPEQIRKYLHNTYVFRENYLGMTALQFLGITGDELKVKITFGNKTYPFTVGLDNAYRTNRHSYDYILRSLFPGIDTINVLMKGTVNGPDSISVVSHTLGTTTTVYQTWRFRGNKIQIEFSYSAGGLPGSFYGSLKK